RRAPRQAAAAVVRASRIRACPSLDGRTDDAKPGVQRQVCRALGRAVPAPRPQVRVDAPRAGGMGGRGRPRVWLRRPLPTRRTGVSRGWGTDADGGVRAMTAEAPRVSARGLEVPELSLVVLVGPSGSG